MSKITSADCVQEIVKLCVDPVKNLEAYALIRDHSDPSILDPNDNYEFVPYSLAEFTAFVTNPKNWKRHSKRQDPEDRTITERVFICVPLGSLCRAYVHEQGGKIVKVWIQGE